MEKNDQYKQSQNGMEELWCARGTFEFEEDPAHLEQRREAHGQKEEVGLQIPEEQMEVWVDDDILAEVEEKGYGMEIGPERDQEDRP
ncbi:hypothetical protein MRB53_034840 [Persea americana]|uniref:Uncharacterized protein n=1 Tax=Persea americana TaxID=3435 RepID=A0ACC2K387_PERAE|nr:hypothetical protein MRB53_034840 [Persea americana]